jgi:hypothetical protein
VQLDLAVGGAPERLAGPVSAYAAAVEALAES